MTSSPIVILARWARVAFETPSDHSHFFGYYDRSPLNADGRHLLAHRVTFDGREVTATDRAAVGYFDLRNGSWRGLGNTAAFNWQQGAMLQWLGPDFQSRVIYNDQDGKRLVSRIVDVAAGHVQTVPHAVYAVHPTGRTALGVRFERHYFCRAYHYEGIRDECWNVPLHPEDGILTIDLDTGTAHLLVRTAAVASLDPTPEMVGVPHWLEHVMWNPSGTRFGFLHRYGSHADFATRVFTADADGTGLFGLPGHRDYNFSHMGWRDDRTFVIFGVRAKPLGKLYASMVRSPHLLQTLGVRAVRRIKEFFPRDFVAHRSLAGGYFVVHDQQGAERMSISEQADHPIRSNVST